MKLLALFSLLTLFTFAGSKDLATSNNTVYYFCLSHKRTPPDSTINYILYTDILKIDEDEQLIKEKTLEWSQLVKTQCKNTSGCTADLNYYYSVKDAETRKKEKRKVYNNGNPFNKEVSPYSFQNYMLSIFFF